MYHHFRKILLFLTIAIFCIFTIKSTDVQERFSGTKESIELQITKNGTLKAGDVGFEGSVVGACLGCFNKAYKYLKENSPNPELYRGDARLKVQQATADARSRVSKPLKELVGNVRAHLEDDIVDFVYNYCIEVDRVVDEDLASLRELVAPLETFDDSKVPEATNEKENKVSEGKTEAANIEVEEDVKESNGSTEKVEEEADMKEQAENANESAKEEKENDVQEEENKKPEENAETPKENVKKSDENTEKLEATCASTETCKAPEAESEDNRESSIADPIEDEIINEEEEKNAKIDEKEDDSEDDTESDMEGEDYNADEVDSLKIMSEKIKQMSMDLKNKMADGDYNPETMKQLADLFKKLNIGRDEL